MSIFAMAVMFVPFAESAPGGVPVGSPFVTAPTGTQLEMFPNQNLGTPTGMRMGRETVEKFAREAEQIRNQDAERIQREAQERAAKLAEESRRAKRQESWATEDRRRELTENCANGRGDPYRCEAHRAADQAARNGENRNEDYWDAYKRERKRQEEAGLISADRHRRRTADDSPESRPVSNPTDPGKSVDTGRPQQNTAQQTQQPNTQQPQTTNDITNQSYQGQNLKQATQPQNPFSQITTALDRFMETGSRPTPSPTQKENPALNNAVINPYQQSTSTTQAPEPELDTSVNSGVARAAVKCYSSAAAAANSCSGALSRAQNVSAKVQQVQASAQSGSPTACAAVGNATSQANTQIQADQISCTNAIAQCSQACASAEAQVASAPGSEAAIQAADGRGVCAAAQATASSIGINQIQIQAAYSAAAQCYQQTTGSEFVPTPAGGTHARRGGGGSDLGAALNAQAEKSDCMGGICVGADAGTPSEQMVDPKKLLLDDEGGKGGGQKITGGGYREAHDMPDFGSKFQATSMNRPKLSGKPGPPPTSNAQVPAKNPGFFIKDKEAERRAREFARLPGTRGQAGPQALGGGGANKAGLERFVRRPANQQGIGAKHTNIFSTITQSYVRNSEWLLP